jgi:hypothetical protein
MIGKLFARQIFKGYPFGFATPSDSPAQHLCRRLARFVSLHRRSILKSQQSPDHRPHLPPSPVAASSADTRASMSSISMALAAWLKMESATRALTDAGVAGSTSSLINVVAAAGA